MRYIKRSGFHLLLAVSTFSLVLSTTPALAQFGGAQIVFDPEMFARQLQQLQ